MMKRLLKLRVVLSFVAFVMLSMFSGNAYAQSTIKGVVVSQTDGTPIIGATVQVQGSSVGTATDLKGAFSIKAAPKSILVIQSLGYSTQEVEVLASKTNYPVTLAEESQSIDDVVVVGYGEMRKKEVTGAVSRLTSENIAKINTTDLGTALQGQIAGVNVTASSGEPGAKSVINIRGVSSIMEGGSSPLYVVDGVPFESDPGLSSNEIASIDVLKDAASSAIYGTRGAGGVILITTKQGVAGRMKATFEANYGVQSITSDIDLMNTPDYIYSKLLNNRENGASTANTDNLAWTQLKNYPTNFFNDSNLYDVIVNDNAPVQNYSLNLSGGQKDITYSVAANYFDQEGILINSDYSRYNLRGGLNFKRNKFSMNASFNVKSEDQLSPGWGLTNLSYTSPPTSVQVDPSQDLSQVDGSNDDAKNVGYSLAQMKEKSTRKTNSYNVNVFAGYNLLKTLNVSSRLGLNYSSSDAQRMKPYIEVYDAQGVLVEPTPWTRSLINENHSTTSSYTWDAMLNWGQKYGKHDVKFTGVFSVEQYDYKSFYAQIYDLVSNDVPSLNAGTNDMYVGTGSGQWGQDRTSTLVGMLGRVQYNYDSRYMFSASLRRDGSSRFSKDNRWGMFPSVSGGWNIAEEKFFAPLKKKISALKLRASYGTTGNQFFEDYIYSTTVNQYYDYAFGSESDQNLWKGAAQTGYANPDVVWETTESINVGLDMTMFWNRISFAFDVYQTSKKDMLFPLMIPPTNGATSPSTVTLNAGNMENSGVEMALGYRGWFKKWNYNVNATFSTNNNKITSMGGASDMYYFSNGNPVTADGNSDYVTVVKTGYEAGAFFVMPTNGVINSESKLADYQKYNAGAKMGDLIYVDTNNDGVLSNADRVYAGSGIPEYELGLNYTFNFYGFDVYMNWYASVGNEIINGTKIYAYQSQTHADLIYQWSSQYPQSSMPAHRGNARHDNFRSYADMWVQDGSFLRLKNVTFGYTLPKKLTQKANLSKVRFYVAADNLLTFTQYDGYDPEVGSNGLSRRGLDYGTYPITRQVRGGVQIEF